MDENLFETKYDLTKKSKLLAFYESNKILIYSFLATFVIIVAIYAFYQQHKEKKKISLSENYIQAKIYLDDGRKAEATEILKNVIFSNDPTYSTLSFFMILNASLINDQNEISNLFDHLLENNKFDKEIKNLLIYKNALYKSNFVEESKLLEETKFLINNQDTIWKAHGFLLLGDFYFSKKEYIKAKDFYLQILSTEKLQPDFYDQAKSRLALISDEY